LSKQGEEEELEEEGSTEETLENSEEVEAC
jgi:hypothetical protein